MLGVVSPPRPSSDPVELPKYLTWPALYHVFLPFFPPGYIPSTVVSPASLDAVPPWSLDLERFYRMFKRATWSILETDDRRDAAFLDELEVKLEKETVEARRTRLLAVRREVRRRRCLRWAKLYAVHAVRQIYLERQREHFPTYTESGLISLAPPGDVGYIAPAAEDSHWPFPFSGEGVSISTVLLNNYRIVATPGYFKRFLFPSYRTHASIAAKQRARASRLHTWIAKLDWGEEDVEEKRKGEGERSVAHGSSSAAPPLPPSTVSRRGNADSSV